MSTSGVYNDPSDLIAWTFEQAGKLRKLLGQETMRGTFNPHEHAVLTPNPALATYNAIHIVSTSDVLHEEIGRYHLQLLELSYIVMFGISLPGKAFPALPPAPLLPLPVKGDDAYRVYLKLRQLH